MSKHHTDEFRKKSKELILCAELKQKRNSKSNSDCHGFKNFDTEHNTLSCGESNCSFNFHLVDEEETKSNQSTSSEGSFHPIVAFDFETSTKVGANGDNASLFGLLFPGFQTGSITTCKVKEEDL